MMYNLPQEQKNKTKIQKARAFSLDLIILIISLIPTKETSLTSWVPTLTPKSLCVSLGLSITIIQMSASFDLTEKVESWW